MKAIDLIRWALQLTDQGTAALVDAMRDAPLTQPTPGGKGGGGNHPMWVIVHLAFIEGGIPHILFGEPNPVAHWAPLFAAGTQPKTDPAAYPPFDEVLRAYRDLRARNLKLLDELGEAGLERAPKNVPPGFENEMKTFGQTLLLIALHNMVHYGQVADARRVAGIKPLV
jgi:DinB superfamily